jgi:flagellar biogenesis protein FliO
MTLLLACGELLALLALIGAIGWALSRPRAKGNPLYLHLLRLQLRAERKRTPR